MLPLLAATAITAAPLLIGSTDESDNEYIFEHNAEPAYPSAIGPNRPNLVSKLRDLYSRPRSEIVPGAETLRDMAPKRIRAAAVAKLRATAARKRRVAKQLPVTRKKKKTSARRTRRIASGAPVSTFSRSSRTYFRQVTTGTSSRVVACDRLPEAVVLDLAGYSAADVNYSGAVLATLQMNPANLGERLRRIASTFETYSFQAMKVHFAPARGTQTAGSMLGFYDQDPVDTFDSGVRSLIEASAHEGAHSIKVWEDGFWMMPPRLQGRFYIDDVGESAADKRLQEQGTFRLLLDVPFDAADLPTGVPFTLGSLYVEYVVDLHKPTIQPNFVGTCDLYNMLNPVGISISTTGSFYLFNQTLFTNHTVAVADHRNNAGSSVPLVSNGRWAIPEGLWSIRYAWGFEHGASATTSTANCYPVASILETGDLSTGLVHDGNVNGPASNAQFHYTIGITTAAQAFRQDYGFDLLVPSGQFRYLDFFIDYTAGAASAATVFTLQDFSITAKWPTPAQRALLTPVLSELNCRIQDLERQMKRLEVTTDSESKEEKAIGPAVPTPTRRVVAPPNTPVSGGFPGFVILEPDAMPRRPKG